MDREDLPPASVVVMALVVGCVSSFLLEGPSAIQFQLCIGAVQLLSLHAWDIAQIVAAPLALDALVGLYHYATDQGWNFRQQVEQFQDHHHTNTMQRWYGWEQLLGVALGIFLGWLLGSTFFYTMGLLTAFAQLPHYFAHHPPTSGPFLWLQQAGLFITPEQHARHHRGQFDQNFCTFTGWNDFWLNRLVARKPGK